MLKQPAPNATGSCRILIGIHPGVGAMVAERKRLHWVRLSAKTPLAFSFGNPVPLSIDSLRFDTTFADVTPVARPTAPVKDGAVKK